jgi:type II secretory pathway component PulL
MQAWELYRLQGERDRLQTTIEQTFRQLMPTARLVNPRAQLETLLRQAQSTRNDNEFMRLLGIAAAALQDYPALQLRRLSFRQNRLELDLRGGDLGQLDTLKTHFRQRQDIAAEINASVRDGQVLSRLSLRFAARGA